jgi:hypothetical protein
MPSIEHPTSTALIPVPEDKIGPMVDPHGESFFTINYCTGHPACFEIILNNVLDTKSEAYL